ncbi:MAG: hypothetical protein ACPIOQ_78505, partial [Promethearchaeia archaeon]
MLKTDRRTDARYPLDCLRWGIGVGFRGCGRLLCATDLEANIVSVHQQPISPGRSGPCGIEVAIVSVEHACDDETVKGQCTGRAAR